MSEFGNTPDAEPTTKVNPDVAAVGQAAIDESIRPKESTPSLVRAPREAPKLGEPPAHPGAEIGQTPMYHPEDDPSRQIKDTPHETSVEPPTPAKPPSGPGTPS